jgi:hypothetical protein
MRRKRATLFLSVSLTLLVLTALAYLGGYEELLNNPPPKHRPEEELCLNKAPYAQARCLEDKSNWNAATLVPALERYEAISRDNPAAQQDAVRVLYKIAQHSGNLEALGKVLSANIAQPHTISAVYEKIKLSIPPEIIVSPTPSNRHSLLETEVMIEAPCNAEVQQNLKTLFLLSQGINPEEHKTWTQRLAKSLLTAGCGYGNDQSGEVDPKRAYELYETLGDAAGMKTAAQDVVANRYKKLHDIEAVEEAESWWHKAEPSFSKEQIFKELAPLVRSQAQDFEKKHSYRLAGDFYRWLGDNERAKLMEEVIKDQEK